MKNIIMVLSLVSFVVIGLNSCKKSSGTAFEHSTMRPWFDKNCQSCHGSGGSKSGAWSYNSDNYESSIKKHISHLYQAVYVNKSMPPGGLTQAELDQFKTWYDAGYPAK
ncbi:MAG: c-type cytochrome [Sphingomonadales bacterium]